MADMSRGLLRKASCGTPRGHSRFDIYVSNARGQGDEWEARGGVRKARGAERQRPWNSVSILVVYNSTTKQKFKILKSGILRENP